MRHHGLMVLAALALVTGGFPADAQSEGRIHMGAMVWRHDTNLRVERATDYDGSDITAGENDRDWDITGSGIGARLRYDFPRLLSIYGEAGASQATVRDKDVTDPNQSVDSRGLNNGVYLALGMQVGDYFSNAGNAFWKIETSLSSVSAGLDRDVNRSWDYEETRLAADGRIGTWVRQIGIYGGLRLVNSGIDLRETDRTNPPSQQARVTELGRAGAVDLLVGAQTRGPEISGFTEIGMVGTFSANAGVTIRF